MLCALCASQYITAQALAVGETQLEVELHLVVIMPQAYHLAVWLLGRDRIRIQGLFGTCHQAITDMQANQSQTAIGRIDRA